MVNQNPHNRLGWVNRGGNGSQPVDEQAVRSRETADASRFYGGQRFLVNQSPHNKLGWVD